MKTQEQHEVIVLDHETAEVIGRVHDDTGYEPDPQTESDLIYEYSPEGRPASPVLNARTLVWLLFGAVAGFILVSVVVYLFYGLAPAALVLTFGTALACLGNPVFWSIPLRAMERNELEHEEIERHHNQAVS